jgi:hypothetical protein
MRARELKIEREKAAEEARIKQEREDREQADLILKWGGEFWGALMVTGYVEESALYTANAAILNGEGPSSSSTLTPGGHSSDAASLGVSSMAGVPLDELDNETQIQLVAEFLQGTTIDDGEETEEDAVPPPALAA